MTDTNQNKSDAEKQEQETLSRILELGAEAIKPKPYTCPSCEQKFHFNMAECLDAYSMTMSLSVSEGRVLLAKTAGQQILNFAYLIEAIGDDYNHETLVAVSDLSFDKKKRALEITLAALPRAPIQGDHDE